ncbi:hypothetical protein [Changchengzhania lutea]|uniref:hypothetical protein n=1 Tax=Changchengzhania lutea TaxID=2049305 RepID=UPI001FEC0354|nr:hypothetical protein [Changchengzhania lutea]
MRQLRTTFSLAMFTILILTATSCKNETKKNETLKMDDKELIAENKVEVKTETTQAYQVGSQVPNELVCMVNNAYMGKQQIKVPVNGKIYYGCCDMCVEKLNNDTMSRNAIDPFSNKQVDKTEAYIVLMNREGAVAYFESKENYLKYVK